MKKAKKSKRKLWDEYKRIHLNFMIAINQSRMITLASTEALADFPNNLPDNIQQPFRATMAKASKVVNESRKKGKPAKITISTGMVRVPLAGDKQGSSKTSLVDVKANNFGIAAFLSGIAQARLIEDQGIPIEKVSRVNFDRPLFFQELVMIFAHLDAFLDDSLKIICRCCPSILKSDKVVTWETAIGLRSYKKLINYLISEYVRKEFHNLPLIDRIIHLKEKRGLDINIPKDTLKYFGYNEQVRHIAVHNAGRIDNEFLLNTGAQDYKMGDPFPISFSIVNELSHKAQVLASYVFKKVSIKFFKIPDSEMDWIWKFPEKKEVIEKE